LHNTGSSQLIIHNLVGEGAVGGELVFNVFSLENHDNNRWFFLLNRLPVSLFMTASIEGAMMLCLTRKSSDPLKTIGELLKKFTN